MTGWRERAECRRYPPGTMWLPTGCDTRGNRAHIARAVAICHHCPVLAECRRYADDLDELGRPLVGVVIAGRVDGAPIGRAAFDRSAPFASLVELIDRTVA